MHASDLIADVIGFLIVLFVLYRYVWRGGLNLSGKMAARQEAIAAEIDESRATSERLVAAEAQYRDSIAGARGEAERTRSEAASEGEQIVADLKVRAEEEYRRMTVLNETRLAAERQSVVSALRQEVGRHTLDLAEQLVARSLQDPARQRRVVDRFVADLDGSRAVGADSASAGSGSAASVPAGRVG